MINRQTTDFDTPQSYEDQIEMENQEREQHLKELVEMYNKTEQDTAHVYYSSVQYEKFSLLAINRPIDDRRIAKIVDAVEKGFDYFHVYPAVVNSQFQVMDGQHRLIAAKMTQRRYYYIIDDNFHMEDAARAVSLTKGWTISNYIDSYSARKLPDYVLVKEFYDQHNWLPISFLVNLCSTQSYRAAIFNHGHYRADRMKFARDFAAMAEDYQKRYDFFKTIPFLNTLTNLANNPEYNHRKMLKKIDLVPTKFKRCATVESYLELMTEIYNYRLADEKRVYFIDRYRRPTKHEEQSQEEQSRE